MRRTRSKDLSDGAARNAALRALGRREHSAAELAARLERRGHAAEAAEQIVEDLAASGWQSDARYAEMLVRARIEQGYGAQRIEAELAAARVPDAEARAALESADCDWRALAQRVHARKFRQPPAGAAEWQKQFRYLASRGFAPDEIYAALKREPDDVQE